MNQTLLEVTVSDSAHDSTDLCPCGSGNSYHVCCGPVLETGVAQTAEALMRSRFVACRSGDVDHLLKTYHPRTVRKVRKDELQAWLNGKDWVCLAVEEVRKGGPKDKSGRVAFTAEYREGVQQFCHREISRFERLNGRWYFVDGKHPSS